MGNRELGSWGVGEKIDTETRRRGDAGKDLHLLTLSAKGESALQDLVKRYQQYLTSCCFGVASSAPLAPLLPTNN